MARSEIVEIAPDFVFALTSTETRSLRRLRSQSVILKRGQNVKYPPLAFSEHGAIMAATVLNSPRAVQMSIFVVQAFLRLREWVAGQAILRAIRELIEPPTSPRRKIGFRTERWPQATPRCARG